MTASGISLQGVGDNLSYLFKNFILNGVSYRAGLATEIIQGKLDANGYPTANTTNGVAWTIYLPSGYTGNYALSFTGNGTVALACGTYTVVSDPDSCKVGSNATNLTVQSNAASIARGVTRVVVKLTANPASFTVSFPGTAATPAGTNFDGTMGNLYLCRLDAPYTADEAAIQSGVLTEMFNTDWLSKMATLNPRILRWMGAEGINGSNLSQHSIGRTPVGNVTYFGARWDPALWSGGALSSGTASGTGAYSCAAATSTPGSYTDGEQVQCQFTNAQPTISPSAVSATSSLATITVPDTSTLTTGQLVYCKIPGLVDNGASGLFSQYALTVVNSTTLTIPAITTFSGAYTTGALLTPQPTIDVGARGAKPIFNPYGLVANTSDTAGGVITAGLFSTLTYDAWLGGWIHTAGALSSCLPVEVIVAACNKLNKDCWICFPNHFTTAAAVAKANYVKSNIATGLFAFFEYGNEDWNQGFPQWHYLITIGTKAFGLSSGSNVAVYSATAVKVAQIMSAIGPSANVIRVLGHQASIDTTIETSLFKGSSLNSSSATYWAKNPVDYSTVGNRPIDICDATSYATYFFGDEILQFDQSYQGLSGTTKIAGLVTAADNYASGVAASMSSALDWFDAQVRYGGQEPIAIGSIGADGTITLASGSNASNSIFNTTQLRLESTVALPSPYTANTPYFVVSAAGTTPGTFKLSATLGGTAISSTSGGSGSYDLRILASSSCMISIGALRAFFNALAVTYNKPIYCYEGGHSSWYPTPTTCTSKLGLTSDYAQKILNLVTAYVNNYRASILVRDQMVQFMTGSKSGAPAQLQVIGNNQWALLNGFNVPSDVTNNGSFLGDINCSINQTWEGVRLFNTNKRRLVW